MSHISDSIKSLHQSLPQGVELVAVSKFHPVESLREAYDAGQRIFGESRVAEFVEKETLMPADTVWHFIGHIQTNKLKKLIGKVDLYESVDSEHLLTEIDELSARAGIISRVLLEVHVAGEESKFGFLPRDIIDFFTQKRYERLKATHICGLMGMATNTDDPERINADFAQLKRLFEQIKTTTPDLRGFDILSMGMSGDYHLAIANGSTHVRIGTAIFGQRDY